MDSSVWGSGKLVEATAIRSSSITTSPPRIRPRSSKLGLVISFADWPARYRSRAASKSSEDWKSIQPISQHIPPVGQQLGVPEPHQGGIVVLHSGSAGQRAALWAGSQNPGPSRPHAAGLFQGAVHSLHCDRSLLSLPSPMLTCPGGCWKAARTDTPWESMDLGSSTPLQGMWEVKLRRRVRLVLAEANTSASITSGCLGDVGQPVANGNPQIHKGEHWGYCLKGPSQLMACIPSGWDDRYLDSLPGTARRNVNEAYSIRINSASVRTNRMSVGSVDREHQAPAASTAIQGAVACHRLQKTTGVITARVSVNVYPGLTGVSLYPGAISQCKRLLVIGSYSPDRRHGDRGGQGGESGPGINQAQLRFHCVEASGVSVSISLWNVPKVSKSCCWDISRETGRRADFGIFYSPPAINFRKSCRVIIPTSLSPFPLPAAAGSGSASISRVTRSTRVFRRNRNQVTAHQRLPTRLLPTRCAVSSRCCGVELAPSKE